MYESIDIYQQLLPLQQHWQEIREEALAATRHMLHVRDSRVQAKKWKVLPLLPEAEDRRQFQPSVLARIRKYAPKTCTLAESIPGVHAYAFSLLSAGGHIRPHRHHNPYVTAALCLEAKGEVFIQVDGEKKSYEVGEFILFDYRRLHEVINNSAHDRMVLLVLLDKKK